MTYLEKNLNVLMDGIRSALGEETDPDKYDAAKIRIAARLRLQKLSGRYDEYRRLKERHPGYKHPDEKKYRRMVRQKLTEMMKLGEKLRHGRSRKTRLHNLRIRQGLEEGMDFLTAIQDRLFDDLPPLTRAPREPVLRLEYTIRTKGDADIIREVRMIRGKRIMPERRQNPKAKSRTGNREVG